MQEVAVKKDTQAQWSRDALQVALKQLQNDKVRKDYLDKALKEFSTSNAAALTARSTSMHSSSTLFETTYKNALAAAEVSSFYYVIST